jgi:hypothetical protein
MWFLVFGVIVLGAAAVALAARRVARELPGLLTGIDALHRDVRPALVRVRDTRNSHR